MRCAGRGQWTRLTTPGDEAVELIALGDDGRVLAQIMTPQLESSLVLREGGTFYRLHWPITDVQVHPVRAEPAPVAGRPDGAGTRTPP